METNFSKAIQKIITLENNTPMLSDQYRYSIGGIAQESRVATFFSVLINILNVYSLREYVISLIAAFTEVS